MPGLADEPLAALLDAVAAADPAPGAGTSAAAGAALAAALLEMCARITLDREAEHPDVPPALPERARALRATALELAQRDLSSFGPVLEAQRLPADDPSRGERLAAALAAASLAPVAIAETAAEVAELVARVTVGGAPAVRGDALAGALLAEAAAAAAAALVELNLAGRDDPDLARARDARRRAQAARDLALGTLPRR